ncbi:MAG: hypothetical protein ACI9F9_002241 [Candidatus Paceibacteria bacterium]|jgi:hypothetical protein
MLISPRALVVVSSLTLLALAACRAPNPTVPGMEAPAAQDRSAPNSSSTEEAKRSLAVPVQVSEPVVARIGDQSIYVSELLSTWMLVDGGGLRDMLGTLVTAHLVSTEAARLNISVDAVSVAEEYGRALAEMEQKLQRDQPGMSLDEWIAGGLGLNPVRFREGLRKDIESRLLAERVVRYFIMTQESTDVAVIVCENEADALAAMERVRGGESFERVAAVSSIDPSGKNGGRIPPIVRNASALSRLAFGTAEGEVGGPLNEGNRWMVLTTHKLNQAIEGSWARIGKQVEASLVERPIEEPEYWIWKTEMNERLPADFEPFFELIGEAGSGARF